ncbi:guanine-N(1)--methyltransferase [Punctularia strigosozonata HHB-11173 SS5]|uniref:guanine-N(1)--methyltransferase n=1 Tax=Punctularia strigosozonata (strain HHB-11173) TaxID=741275 RepID=UPI0004416C9D|nr:guanine-N(1)--methyltransferase [Punctularia strigosozonata HHB-11173 SS5]EIN13881.1 guanine-N(1)--methyltransferase [Punctularia strigosozonata HHB-11173 SS5]
MHRAVGIDTSPPSARWMKDRLDRDFFKRSVEVVGAKVPAEKTGPALTALQPKRAVLRIPKIKTAVPLPSGDRLILLNYSKAADVAPDVKSYLDTLPAELLSHHVDLEYDYWTAEEILHAILPEELCDGAPAGFAMTGHIAHMNLNDEYLPYKHMIGQVILDKNPAVRTVVNKLDSIDHQFRFFKMELLAGEPDYVVEHHESGCRFTFDFTQVYWNSRLHTEHDRLVQSFKSDDIVADVFAGVGPFAVPAAKKGCAVLANDLNPNSAKYLQKNVDDNKVGDLVRVSCEDGRDFIRTAVTRVQTNPFPPYKGPKPSRSQEKSRRRAMPAADVATPIERQPRQVITHFVMNLPDSAITFLDAFRGIYTGALPEFSEIVSESGNQLVASSRLPMIHCHCFTRELEAEKAEADIRQRVQVTMGAPLTEEVSLHLVRSVAPNKHMYCISFRLPAAVAFNTP